MPNNAQKQTIKRVTSKSLPIYVLIFSRLHCCARIHIKQGIEMNILKFWNYVQAYVQRYMCNTESLCDVTKVATLFN